MTSTSIPDSVIFSPIRIGVVEDRNNRSMICIV
jgi:hypothetical protein